MALGTAFRSFFKTLFNNDLAARVQQVLDGEAPPEPTPAIEEKSAPEPTPAPEPPQPARGEAVTLLATLQREARLIDFLQESLDAYEDAQIGAAVRDVQRDSKATLARLFDLQPVTNGEEGTPVTLPAPVDPGEYTLSGNVTDAAGKTGTLLHHGWKASKCDLPEWTGSDAAADVVAPAEVELK